MRKERHRLKYRSTKCLNCEHPLDISDEYCPNCSQLNCTKKLTFTDFFNEFFAGIFAYDSRFYRTLGVLLFKPGKISKDYIEGKRVRYANPYKFYLSASIIFFLIWSLTHENEEGFTIASETTAEDLATVDSLRIAAGADYVPEEALDTLPFYNSVEKKAVLFEAFHVRTKIRDAEVAMDSLSYTNSNFNRWLYNKTLDTIKFREDSNLFMSYFIGKLPFIIFFYLPVFALFIWLLYFRRPFTYMEHLIFTFHNQTTWFVLFGISINFGLLLNTDWFNFIAILTFLIYLYKAFRTFYGQSRVKTFLKFIIINIIFLILGLIAALFSLMVSFILY